jgi:para-nitrobenzyl esterase
MRARRPTLPRSRFARALLVVTLASAAAAAVQAGSAASAPQSAPAATVPCAPDTVRQTINGPVCGIAVNNDDEWLGIPYAAPPIGDLRWAPPQPPAPWTSPLEATAFGSSCAQSFFSTSGSEDCLFVNVTRPADATDDLPVLVHIHGGGFVAGSGNGNYSLLADTGHEVVVSLN